MLLLWVIKKKVNALTCVLSSHFAQNTLAHSKSPQENEKQYLSAKQAIITNKLGYKACYSLIDSCSRTEGCGFYNVFLLIEITMK